MECEEVRQALSARIDGEPMRPGWDDAVIDAHLATCEDCQAWYTSALALSRSLRVAPAEEPAEIPDFSAQIMATVSEEDLPKQRSWRVISLALSRIMLLVVGVAYIVWALYLLHSSTTITPDGLPAYTGPGGAVGDSRDPVLGRLLVDAAAIRLAMGFSMFWCVWKPRATAGVIPLFGAVWGFSLGFATRDLVLGFASMQQVLGLILFLVTVAALIWCWFSQYGGTAEAARGSLKSFSARPVRTTLEDARHAAEAVHAEDQEAVRRQVHGEE